MSTKMIAHMDADCFYVAAERVRCPALRGQPAAVISNQGAFVIAKSYEMTASGVKTGTSIWDARRLCPEGIYVKRSSATLSLNLMSNETEGYYLSLSAGDYYLAGGEPPGCWFVGGCSAATTPRH